MRLLIFLMTLVFSMSVYANANIEIWHNPEASQNIETYFPGLRLNINEVEFHPDETIIRLHLKSLRPGMTCKIPSSTTLRDGEKNYALRSVESLDTDVMFEPSLYTGESLVLHFEPLSAGCESFDLLMGDRQADLKISGIKLRTTRLEESCWRDEKTGDWIIGIFPEGVVYDNAVWNYISRDDHSGKYMVTDGKNRLTIEAGKEKNGKRKFKIGNQPAVTLSRIIGNTLPAYPHKEYKTAFYDSGYQKEDSVIISGWLRGLPEIVTQHRGRDINVYYNNIFTGRQEKVSTEMDSIGRFHLTFRIPNTTHIMLDTKSNDISFPIEPGKKYFVLDDLAGQKRLLMGDDVRVQNELVSYGIPFSAPRIEETNNNYLEIVDSWQNEVDMAIDDISRNNPTLSELFVDYLHKNAMLEMAFVLAQSRSHFPDATFPPEVETYVTDNYWQRLPKQVNAYSESGVSFINNIVEDAYSKSHTVPFKMADGRRAFITIPDELAETLSADIKLLQSGSEVATDLSADSVMNAFKRISMKVTQFLDEKGHDYWHLSRMKEYESVLRNLEATPEITDIFMSSFYDGVMKTEMAPLSDDMEAHIDSVFSGQVFKNFAMQNNDRYKALLSSAKQSQISINNGKDIKDLSNGKALFRKIVEPYKGRPLLIDVWGTWCGPCREAMKDFSTERDALAPYNVVFVFLANNSKDEVIKGLVEEYGIVGENVVHYNFPVEQQQALERFLKVSAYPCYRLVDPDGNLIDADVDARNIEGLMKLLNRIVSKP